MPRRPITPGPPAVRSTAPGVGKGAGRARQPTPSGPPTDGTAGLGRFLERLRVGAFDVADLYRAAWVQAVSALDHWVHRELYDRAVGFALQPAARRPARFLQIQVPMSLLEDVQDGTATMREAFTAELRRQFGYQSFQAPEKIKQALANVSDVPLWPNLARELARTQDGTPVIAEAVQAQLREIVKRRNRIAHEADRDPDHPGDRNPIFDTEVTQTIDWIQRMAVAAATVLGPPPADPTVEPAARTPAVRRAAAVQRLITHHAVTDGTELTITVPDLVDQDRDAIRAWLDAEPDRARVHWHNDINGPVEWAYDQRRYRIIALIRHVIETATGQPPRAQIWPPTWYRRNDGRTLHQIADPLP